MVYFWFFLILGPCRWLPEAGLGVGNKVDFSILTPA